MRHFFCWGGVFAQQDVTPPKFNGAGIDYYMGRLAGETKKVILERKIPAGELSRHVAVAFRVDTAGRTSEWRFCDNTSEGQDRCDCDPATEATRRAMTEAFARLDGWRPAVDGAGRATDYTVRMTLEIPVKSIAWQQNPLRFMGGDMECFRKWVVDRVRYHESQVRRGRQGRVEVKFRVEADGSVTIEKITGPDERLTREVARVIRKSEGKWTPRLEDGVPQRTDCNFSVNFNGAD